jgi:VIT1/CCC1 family predicted Fe2+/Mn2+ transporter
MRREHVARPVTKRPPETLPELQAEHKPAPRGRLNPPHGETEENSPVRNYVRDLILGFNDGLVSVFAVCAGVAAADGNARIVALAGVAAGTAGALSMGLGEYLSTKSQAEYYANEAKREREHIRQYPKLERQEVTEMLTKKHYPDALIEPIAEHIVSNEDRFVDFMMREEFGVGEEAERSPFVAMGLVMLAFVVGAVLPLLPFLFGASGAAGLGISAAFAVVGLFAAGSIKAVTSGLKPWRSGLEMLVFGIAAAAVTYGVGLLVKAWLGVSAGG